MPRDLFFKQSDEESPLTLTRSPESQASNSMATGQDDPNDSALRRNELGLANPQLRSKGANISVRNDLHPYVQTLSLADVESCVALENATFPELERCSREKVSHLKFVFPSCPFSSAAAILRFVCRLATGGLVE